jgi:replication-associated recombination protein RarA
MSSLPYDPWQKVQTRHGLPADEVISALQKEIRRGQAENAVLLAYEMVVSSVDMEQYLWKRLLCISVEDVGLGNPRAALEVNNLYQMHQVFARGEGDRMLFAIHAVRILCASPKDRSTDEMVNWMIHAVEEEGLRPQIPDYAIDKHTARGQVLGRDDRHFWEVGAQLAPEWAERDKTYRERVLKLLK